MRRSGGVGFGCEETGDYLLFLLPHGGGGGGFSVIFDG